jgi:hypothetical protein
MPDATRIDYLARIPLTIDGNDQVVRIYRDPKLPGDAADQVNDAIAALVALAVERDRESRGGESNRRGD